MKRIFTIIFIFFAFSVSASYLVSKGDSAYVNDDYNNAIRYYNQAIETDGTSSELYYNLGNAYYRAGNIGYAIVNYERALKLAPNDDDIIANLEFVNSKIKDIPTNDKTLLHRALECCVNAFTPNAWAVISIVIFVLFLLAIGLYIFATKVIHRKIGFFGALILLIINIATIIFAIMGTNRITEQRYAIIIQPSTMLSTTPREPKNRAEEAVLLHEGTKVYIIDSIKNETDAGQMIWYDVRYSGKNRAWIKAIDVEKI